MTNRFRETLFSLSLAAQLWWAGVLDALCVWRCVEFFVHDPRILRKTGQCFTLNGTIFLGSILVWESALVPSLRWLLSAGGGWAGAEGARLAVLAAQALFFALWLVPVYCLSFGLSSVWYSEIAKLAVGWMDQERRAGGAPPHSRRAGPPAVQGRQPRGGPSVLEAAAAEVYRVVLFGVAYAQAAVLGALPVVGTPLYCVLASWLFALYSFDYVWGLTNRSLPARVAHFERHWAFFLGYGSVCTALTLFWPFFKGGAVMAMVYPFFILTACRSDPAHVFAQVAARERAAGRSAMLRPLPVFAPSTWLTARLLQHGHRLLALPAFLVRRAALVGLALLGGGAVLLASSRGGGAAGVQGAVGALKVRLGTALRAGASTARDAANSSVPP